jgi:predicted RNA-binding protein with EMAP domain
VKGGVDLIEFCGGEISYEEIILEAASEKTFNFLTSINQESPKLSYKGIAIMISKGETKSYLDVDAIMDILNICLLDMLTSKYKQDQEINNNDRSSRF